MVRRCQRRILLGGLYPSREEAGLSGPRVSLKRKHRRFNPGIHRPPSKRSGGYMQKRILVLAAVAVCLISLPFVARNTFAQAVAGTLLGTVQDSSGAVIPGANVTLTNEGTNVTNQTTTGPQGFFTFPNLNPAQYSVTVEA